MAVIGDDKNAGLAPNKLLPTSSKQDRVGAARCSGRTRTSGEGTYARTGEKASFRAAATLGGTKCWTSPPNFATCFTKVELV
jgi:hypothetical protein